MIKFETKIFNDLKITELYDILQLRSEIFVVEQNCVYNDLDGFDKEAVHLLHKKEGKIVAYARILKPGTRFADFSIGRVVVKESERGTGLGIELMEAAKNHIINALGATKIKISAQSYLQRFYENLGFEVITEMYLEDGIPHFGMLYLVKNQAR